MGEDAMCRISNKLGVYESLAQRIGRSERRNVWTVCKWACAIALVLLNVGYLAYQNIDLSKPVYKEVCSLKGKRLVVLLEDGTRVWLNADSKLVYPEQFAKDKREVSLVGEAYFEVKKDISKPFMVQADEMNIRVTGTSFDVSGLSDGFGGYDHVGRRGYSDKLSVCRKIGNISDGSRPDCNL